MNASGTRRASLNRASNGSPTRSRGTSPSSVRAVRAWPSTTTGGSWSISRAARIRCSGAASRGTRWSWWRPARRPDRACVLMLVEQGLLDLDETVSRIGPSSATPASATSRCARCSPGGPAVSGPGLRAHRSGSRRRSSPSAPARAAGAVVAPRHRVCLSPVTWGAILGELVRRAVGQTIGEWFAANVAAPLDLEFWIGLPAALDDRVAHGVWPSSREGLTEPDVADTPEPASHAARRLAAIAARPPREPDAHDPALRRAYYGLEVPASHGIANALSLARPWSVRSTASDCCRGGASPRRRHRRRTACRRCRRDPRRARPSASASDTNCRRRACRGSAPRRSATPEPAAVSPSRIATPASRSPTSPRASGTLGRAATPAGGRSSTRSATASARCRVLAAVHRLGTDRDLGPVLDATGSGGLGAAEQEQQPRNTEAGPRIERLNGYWPDR
jgi:hypothetical protein